MIAGVDSILLHLLLVSHPIKARFVSGLVGRISFAVSAMGLSMGTSPLQADSVVLTGDAGGGADRNWATVENWDTEVCPEGNDLEFSNDGKTDEGVVGNVVDSDLEINSLYYRNDPPNWHVTEIAENVTLTITGSRLIDGVNAALSFGRAGEAGQNARTQIFGQGTLIIDSPSGVIDIAGWSSPPTRGYHLPDMSGLATFAANVDANGLYLNIAAVPESAAAAGCSFTRCDPVVSEPELKGRNLAAIQILLSADATGKFAAWMIL